MEQNMGELVLTRLSNELGWKLEPLSLLAEFIRAGDDRCAQVDAGQLVRPGELWGWLVYERPCCL